MNGQPGFMFELGHYEIFPFRRDKQVFLGNKITQEIKVFNQRPVIVSC
ncbi:hypothetical protein GALL_425760 [mine drainage metagenome]|uniref:Uncharacterized protein n=1 Tax=mine drainage metagenome TaxID=410659 RepID=A0A1J5PXH9_9ZZZZ